MLLKEIRKRYKRYLVGGTELHLMHKPTSFKFVVIPCLDDPKGFVLCRYSQQEGEIEVGRLVYLRPKDLCTNVEFQRLKSKTKAKRKKRRA